MRRNFRITLLVIAVLLATATVSMSSAVAQDASFSSEDVALTEIGETGNSAITVDSGTGISIANVEVSIDTSVAEITGVQEGADVDSSDESQVFDTVDQTADSVRIEYSNIGAEAEATEDFELAVVEFEAAGSGDTPIDLTDTQLFDGNQDEPTVDTTEATLSVDASPEQTDDDTGESDEDDTEQNTDEDDSEQTDEDAGESDEDGTEQNPDEDDSTEDDGDSTPEDGGDGATSDDGSSEETDGDTTDTPQGDGEPAGDGGENAETGDGTADGGGDGEGLPGFTILVAVVAFSVAALIQSKTKR